MKEITCNVCNYFVIVLSKSIITFLQLLRPSIINEHNSIGRHYRLSFLCKEREFRIAYNLGSL